MNIIKTQPHAPHRLQIILGLILVIVGVVMDGPSELLLHEGVLGEQKRKINPYEEISLEGVSAIVWDVKNKQALYAHNAESQLPLASLAKVLTSIVALENIEQGHPVSITTRAIENEGDSGFLRGERWYPEDLVALTLISSSNDGAAALAEAVSSMGSEGDTNTRDFFDHKVLETIQKVGMKQTYILNASGLDLSKTTSGAYGSALDIAHLFRYTLIHHPTILESTTYESEEFISLNNKSHYVENTNALVSKLPGIIGSKTGFTDLAGGNLAVVFDAGLARPMIAVVLGSSQEGRFSDVEQLVSATFEYLKY